MADIEAHAAPSERCVATSWVTDSWVPDVGDDPGPAQRGDRRCLGHSVVRTPDMDRSGTDEDGSLVAVMEQAEALAEGQTGAGGRFEEGGLSGSSCGLRHAARVTVTGCLRPKNASRIVCAEFSSVS